MVGGLGILMFKWITLGLLIGILSAGIVGYVFWYLGTVILPTIIH